MDLFDIMKDITRAYHEQKRLPSPDGQLASAEAHRLVGEAQEFLAQSVNKLDVDTPDARVEGIPFCVCQLAFSKTALAVYHHPLCPHA